jgi:hypothetical protein
MGVFRLTQLAIADLQSIGRYTQATWGRDRETVIFASWIRLFSCYYKNPIFAVHVTMFVSVIANIWLDGI